MSIKQQNYVAGIRGLTSAEAFVLYRLADHAHADGTKCFPGMQILAYETRLDERTVRYVLRNLEDFRLIEPAVSVTRKFEYILRLEAAWKKGEIARASTVARPPRRVTLTATAPPDDLPAIPTAPPDETLSPEQIEKLKKRVADYESAVIRRPQVAAMWKTGADRARQRLEKVGVKI